MILKLVSHGEFPYTHGIHHNLYREALDNETICRLWLTEDTNDALRKYLLAHGQTGLSTAFDMPTLMGWDSKTMTCRVKLVFAALLYHHPMI